MDHYIENLKIPPAMPIPDLLFDLDTSLIPPRIFTVVKICDNWPKISHFRHCGFET